MHTLVRTRFLEIGGEELSKYRQPVSWTRDFREPPNFRMNVSMAEDDENSVLLDNDENGNVSKTQRKCSFILNNNDCV